MNLLLTLLVAVLAAASSFLPSTGGIIFDNSNRVSGFKRLRKKGWWTLFLIITLITVTVIQYWYNDAELKSKENKAQIIQDYRDSIQRIRYDSIVTVNNLKVVKLLAEYGLKQKLDNGRLIKIVQDSSKTRVILPSAPVIDLCYEKGIYLDKNVSGAQHYILKFCSYDAGATSFILQLDVVALDTLNKKSFVGSFICLDYENKIPKNSEKHEGINIRNDSVVYKNMYFHLEGTYQNLEKTNTYKIDEYYMFQIKSKEFSSLIQSSGKRIFKGLKK